MALGSESLGSVPLGGSIVPPAPESGTTSQGIPFTAPQVPQEAQEPELKLYKISFESYKPKECEITEIAPHNGKAALTVLRDVGIFYSSKTNFTTKEGNGVQIIPIDNDGEYTVLYKGLDEASIFEIKLKKQQKNKEEVDLRVFYYTIEPDKTFYVVAVKSSKHYDTDKGDRGRHKRERQRNFKPFRRH